VFELMSYFSGYGFNKSHSAAYALIAYQCAYLKAHYPVEFLCATMSADKDKIEKVVRTVAEARGMGITVLPPDVNESEIDFTVVYDPNGLAAAVPGQRASAPPTAKNGKINNPNRPRKPDEPAAVGGVLRDPMRPRIRFGLGAVKGVGSAALEAIFETRRGEPGAKKPEPFADLYDLAGRVDLRRVNKSVIEALVQCGALDGAHEPLGVSRARAFAALDAAVERGKKASADRESGQTDLFGMLSASDDGASAGRVRPLFAEGPQWERKELLQREKATLGFYISGHPLDGYVEELRRFCNATTVTASDKPDGTQVAIGGIVEDLRVRPMRTGGKIGFFQLEDPYGRLEIVVRGKALESYLEVLQSDAPVLIRGVVREDRERGGSNDDGPPQGTGVMRVVLDKAEPLVEAFRSRTRSVRVKVRLSRVNKDKLVALRRTLEDFPGSCPVTLDLVSEETWRVTLGTKKILVDPTEAMLSQLERLFGEKVCELR
jgi:DNA polymerase-3 subunit alpha